MDISNDMPNLNYEDIRPVGDKLSTGEKVDIADITEWILLVGASIIGDG